MWSEHLDTRGDKCDALLAVHFERKNMQLHAKVYIAKLVAIQSAPVTKKVSGHTLMKCLKLKGG